MKHHSLSPDHPHYHDPDYFAMPLDYDLCLADLPDFDDVDDEFIDYLDELDIIRTYDYCELLLYVHFLNPDSTVTTICVYFPYEHRRNAHEILNRLNAVAPVKSIANDCSIDPSMIDCFVRLDELETAVKHMSLADIAAETERKINDLH